MSDPATSTDLMPVKMLASTLETGQLAGDWTLAGNGPGEDGLRRYEQSVVFEAPFSRLPVVQVGLIGFDIDNCGSARLGVRVADITPNGFTVVLETWRDTRVYGVKVSWLALGF